MEVFVARQPIFNAKEEIVAYELLYRNNKDNVFPNIDGDRATAEVIINGFINIGIEDLSNGKPCFINFTEALLKLGLPTYFKQNEIVVEILEHIKPSKEVIEICRKLKAKGYKIALDDFTFDDSNPYFYEYIYYADIIKVDFLQSTPMMCEEIEVVAQHLGIKLLAEKVETREDYERAKEKGYDLFQGYFFAKPTILSNHDVPSFFHSYLEINNELSSREPEIKKIVGLIERDLSLSYKLLRLINTPGFRCLQKIKSIDQAIMLLGFIELQKWIYVLAIRDRIAEKSELYNEITSTCLTRAKACEAISRLNNNRSFSTGHFMVGMFSLMDTLLGVPMDKLLKELPLSDEISEALNGKDNEYKEILDLVIDIEKGNWEALTEKCAQNGIDENKLFFHYGTALNWANELVFTNMLEEIES